METTRLYIDTSVFGGCFDEGFSEASIGLFELVREGTFRLVLSQTTLDELDEAPERVQDVLRDLPRDRIELIEPSPEIVSLREEYLKAGVVGPSSKGDAAHIAAATVARVDMIVSWNFRHIVHYDKIRGYHGVNLLRGYSAIPIHSPPEVV